MHLLRFEKDSKKGARESQRIGRDFTLEMIIFTLIREKFEIFRSRKKLTRESQKIGRDYTLEMIIFTLIRERERFEIFRSIMREKTCQRILENQP